MNGGKSKKQLHRQIDKFRDQITSWYVDEKLSAAEIRDRLQKLDLELTHGQVNYTIHRFSLKRQRNANSPKFKQAAVHRCYGTAICLHCKLKFDKKTSRHVYCNECAPSSSWWRRIKLVGVGKREASKMHFEQNGACAICELQITLENAAVDHDHTTTQVRGLLCRSCNLKLGVVEDSQFLEKSLKYLNRFKYVQT